MILLLVRIVMALRDILLHFFTNHRTLSHWRLLVVAFVHDATDILSTDPVGADCFVLRVDFAIFFCDSVNVHFESLARLPDSRDRIVTFSHCVFEVWVELKISKYVVVLVTFCLEGPILANGWYLMLLAWPGILD